MEMLNLENLFSNVKIENDKRLSAEDNEKMEEYKKVLADMREKFKLYLVFYKENPIKNIDYDGKIKNVMGVKNSIYTFEEEFIINVIFKQTTHFINDIYCYFKNKYNVTLEYKEHNTDYYVGRQAKAEENFNYFMNVSIDDILDDIFNQLGNISFDDRALEEVKKEIKDACKSWRDEKIVTVKNGKITIKDFIYYDSWALKWSEGYRNNNQDKIVNLFKLVTYYNTNELNNNYEFITKPLNDYDNKYIGIYEINDSILKSFKTFKNGKIELNFTNGLKALDFAKKYLGYQE